ncbi:hypothetical protein IJ579_04370 [bacterium]|nr:hypothetical protein [bacterium]
MKLQEKLKSFENQYVFIRWAMGGEYGKLRYVGEDYIEFDIVDVNYMTVKETMLIASHLIFEVAIGGADIARIVAEISSQLN